MLESLVHSDECVVASLRGAPQQLAVLDTGPALRLGGLDLMLPQRVHERMRNRFVKK